MDRNERKDQLMQELLGKDKFAHYSIVYCVMSQTDSTHWSRRIKWFDDPDHALDLYESFPLHYKEVGIDAIACPASDAETLDQWVDFLNAWTR